MVKSLTSNYMLGERNKSGGWVKMKPEYGDYLDDLDVVIIGECMQREIMRADWLI